MPDISIPQVRRIVVDTRGAQIVQEESPAVCHFSDCIEVSDLFCLLACLRYSQLMPDSRFEGYLPTSLYRACLAYCC